MPSKCLGCGRVKGDMWTPLIMDECQRCLRNLILRRRNEEQRVVRRYKSDTEEDRQEYGNDNTHTEDGN